MTSINSQIKKSVAFKVFWFYLVLWKKLKSIFSLKKKKRNYQVFFFVLDLKLEMRRFATRFQVKFVLDVLLKYAFQTTTSNIEGQSIETQQHFQFKFQIRFKIKLEKQSDVYFLRTFALKSEQNSNSA